MYVCESSQNVDMKYIEKINETVVYYDVKYRCKPKTIEPCLYRKHLLQQDLPHFPRARRISNHSKQIY